MGYQSSQSSLHTWNLLPDAQETPAPVRITIELHLGEFMKLAMPLRSFGVDVIVRANNRRCIVTVETRNE